MTGPLHILLIVCMLLATPLTCYADIYKYRDKDGRLNFVDDENKIPAEYRDRTKSIAEADDALGAFDSPAGDDDIDALTDQEEEFDNDSISEVPEEYQTPIVINGNRVLVPVEVALGNRVAKLSLLLDTGASATVLHRSSLSELDLPSGNASRQGLPVAASSIQTGSSSDISMSARSTSKKRLPWSST